MRFEAEPTPVYAQARKKQEFSGSTKTAYKGRLDLPGKGYLLQRGLVGQGRPAGGWIRTSTFLEQWSLIPDQLQPAGVGAGWPLKK